MTSESHLTPEQIRELIQEQQRRLFFLEQHKARFGFNTAPEVLAEIEEITKRLENLRSLLQASEQPSPALPVAPSRSQPVIPTLSATTQPTVTLSDSSVDFVLVTALPEERDAVLDKLPGYSQLPPAKDDIRTYFQADLPVSFPDNSTGRYRVIVMCLLGMGRVQAVTATVDAIRHWHPRYIVLIGIAGGIAARNLQIGDILISDLVVDYELQKLTPEGPEVRWDVQRADARLLDACNNFRSESWQELIKIKRPGRGKPNTHIGPIASGDKVIAFSDVLARYQDVWPKLLGVEMEAAGVATAAFQSSDRPGFFMVRGVSDLADENKGSSDVGKWRSYACDAAASFAIALLRSGPIPPASALGQSTALPMSGSDLEGVDPTKLRRAMHSAYDRPAFEILCKELGLDYDELRGETLETKMLYLIDSHQRRRQYAGLVRKVLAEHPYLIDELR